MAGVVTGRHRGPVAQGIEQQPSKLKVAGSNPAGVTTYEMRFNAFKELGSKLANLSPRLSNVCSPLFYCEGLSRQLRLINRLCWITEGCLPAASGSGLHGTSDCSHWRTALHRVIPRHPIH